MIRVQLPYQLRILAQIKQEVQLEVSPPITQKSVLNALEQKFPMLQGAIRDHTTQQRRPFIRFFADGEDISLTPPDAALPEVITTGAEPLLIIGAIAGG